MRTLFLLLIAVLSPLILTAQQSQNQASTRSPHGPLSMPCQACHTSTSWKPLRSFPDFDHNKTKYPLRGMHKSVACIGCHVKLVFTQVGHACADCHADIHRGQLGAKCDSCHTVRGWQVSIKDIQQHQNRFPLIGAHSALTCDSCHKGAATGQFAGLSTACVSCHSSDFAKTTNPNHTAAGFPQTCEQCHDTTSWLNATFDHSKTAFPLTGAHTTVQCAQCHTTSNFAATPTACVGCHLADFRKTTNPNHITAGFPQTCEQCHNTTTWFNVSIGANFDHSRTAFPLTGAHKTVACLQCHTPGNFTTAPTRCVGCHLANFQKTTNPNHVKAGFPTDCSICHSTTNWLGATFDHSKTAFPLTGAHIALSCSSCHASGVFVGLSTACVSCHLSTFQHTTNPNHVTSGFPTDCSLCHSTVNWTSSTFDHSKTVFPLTGAHTTVACTSCHVNGNFTTTPTDCYSCHKSQYTGTTSPNHIAAGFPTTCATCHNTTAWTGATFNHTFFPIYSGTHVPSVWVTCSACHINPANYATFSCIACHTHNKPATDARHSGVGNYVYAPTACYSCHKS